MGYLLRSVWIVEFQRYLVDKNEWCGWQPDGSVHYTREDARQSVEQYKWVESNYRWVESNYRTRIVRYTPEGA